MTFSYDKFLQILSNELTEIRKDLKEIRGEQKKTCVEIEKQKLLLTNHLKCMDKKIKSRREKILLLIAISGVSVAALSWISSIFFR